MDKLNKLDDELEAMKDLYIKMVKNATMGLENGYDSEDDIEDCEDREDNQEEIDTEEKEINQK